MISFFNSMETEALTEILPQEDGGHQIRVGSTLFDLPLQDHLQAFAPGSGSGSGPGPGPFLLRVLCVAGSHRRHRLHGRSSRIESLAVLPQDVEIEEGDADGVHLARRIRHDKVEGGEGEESNKDRDKSTAKEICMQDLGGLDSRNTQGGRRRDWRMGLYIYQQEKCDAMR